MLDGNKVPLEDNLEVNICQENVVNSDSAQEEGKVSSENISTSNERRGEKRSLEEESHKSDLPQELKQMFKPLKCELCNVIVSTPIVAYTHYEGKTHKKNINSYMKKHYNVENSVKVNKNAFDPVKCETCDIILSSNVVYQQHLAGKKHKKELKRSKLDPIIPVSESEIDLTGRFGIGKAFLKENELPSQSTSSIQSVVYCEVCTVFADSEQQMDIHKQGKKHAKNVAKRKIIEKLSLPTKEAVSYYNCQDVKQTTLQDK